MSKAVKIRVSYDLGQTLGSPIDFHVETQIGSADNVFSLNR